MNRSESIKELAAALAEAQGAMGRLVKDREVTVRGEKGAFAYGYATLAEVWAVIRAPLSGAGIAVVQGAENGQLETLLVHDASGEWICLSTPIMAPEKCGPQQWGSALTYARRYALLAALGLAAEDDDGAAAQAARSGPATTAPTPPPPLAPRPARPVHHEVVVPAGDMLPDGPIDAVARPTTDPVLGISTRNFRSIKDSAGAPIDYKGVPFSLIEPQHLHAIAGFRRDAARKKREAGETSKAEMDEREAALALAWEAWLRLHGQQRPGDDSEEAPF